jgi:cysteine desulfurase
MAEKDHIYLDYNATALIRPEVIELMADVMREGGNPSSVHAFGRNAKARLEGARAAIVEAINCRPQMVIFTSGGTEANNMAVFSSNRTRLITTNAEHDSLRASSEKFDGKVDIVPVDKNGLVDLNVLEELLKNDGENTIVSILYANNETGVLQDIEAISSITRAADALLHIDAIQAFGKVPLNFMELNVDMMSISSHKIGGPQGVGALIAREKLPVKSIIVGGGQEHGRRGGTENIAGIAGFGLAASMVPDSLEKMKTLRAWRNEIEHELKNHTPDVMLLGQGAKRLPNVSNIYMPDVISETQVMNFDLNGICISAGSACSSGKVKTSHVGLAMLGDEKIASCTIRMSLGWASAHRDIDAFIKAWKKIYDKKHA